MCGLHANAEAVDAERAKLRQIRLRDGAGIRFQGDFAVRCQGEILRTGAEDRLQSVNGHQTGRAAAKKDRGHGLLRLWGNHLQFAHNGLRIRCDKLCFPRVRVECAVGTTRFAEWNVDIDRQLIGWQGIINSATLALRHNIR